MRNLSIDYLRVLLAFFIILIHTNFLINVDEDVNYFMVNGFLRLAQPIFLIISGYYFYKIFDLIKLKEWLCRLLFIYVFWMLIYLNFWFSFDDFLHNIKQIFLGYYVLWYVIGVVYASCILFLLRDRESNKIFLLSLFLYSFGVLMQTIGGLHLYDGKVDQVLNDLYFYRNFLFKCLPFMILGFIIKRESLDVEISYWICLIFIFILLFFLFFEIYLNYKFLGVSKPIDYLFVSFFLCPLFFIFFKKIKIYGRCKMLASFSVSLYLTHPLFMYLFYKLDINLNYPLFVLILSSLTSLLLSFIVDKYKILRKIL